MIRHEAIDLAHEFTDALGGAAADGLALLGEIPVSAPMARTLQCVAPFAGLVCRAFWINSATRSSLVERGLPGRSSSYSDAPLDEASSATCPRWHGSVPCAGPPPSCSSRTSQSLSLSPNKQKQRIATSQLAEASGLRERIERIERSGARLFHDACPGMIPPDRLFGPKKVFAADSVKMVRLVRGIGKPNFLFGPLTDLMNAAVTGKFVSTRW